jgi:hypothetical protein
MTFQFSTDNTNWDDVYTFTYAAADGARRFQFPVTAQYFRIVYTNGGTTQTHFRVQTILHRQNVLTSIHRLADNTDPDRSAQVMKSALIARVNGTGDFIPVQANASGVLKIGGSVDGSETEDAAVAGNPTLSGGRYDATARTLDDGDAGALALDAGGRAMVSGGAAHDTAVAGNPVPVAARANANEPTAVGDGDATHLWADTFGRLVVVPGHPSPELPVVVNATASGDTTVVSAPGAGVSLYIVRVALVNGGTAVVSAQLQEASSATNRGGGDLAANGGGMILDYGARGWKLTANTALQINLGATGDVWVSVLEHYIAP